MDRERKRQILQAEDRQARIDQLARDLADRGFYILGGIRRPPAEPASPPPEAGPAYWTSAPKSR